MESNILSDEEREKIAKNIFLLCEKYATHPYLINCGLCEDFAFDLCEMICEDGICDGDPVVWGLPDEYSHSCVRYKGFFFDSEEPYGVAHWRQLPSSARKERKLRKNAKHRRS